MDRLAHAQTSPISRLPHDILYHIFLLTINLTPKWEDIRSRSRLPVTLSHVCRSWRAVAIGSPILWTLIVFDRPPPYDQQRLWIARSKGAGLRIRINKTYGTKQTTHLVQLLRPHVAHWKSLRISQDFKPKSFRLFLDELRHEVAPMLQSMRVENWGQNRRWRFRPFGGVVPSLSRLEIGDHRLNASAPMFSRLKRLVINRVSGGLPSSLTTTSDIFTILVQASSTLERLYISVKSVKCVARPKSIQFPVALPRLSAITLASPSYSLYNPLLWVLEVYTGILAPNLDSHDFNTPTLQHLLNDGILPFPGLTSLTISCEHSAEVPELDRSALMGIFSMLPGLKSFTVNDMQYFDPSILASTCPQLQNLYLFHYARVAKVSGLRAMVEARQLRAGNMGVTDSLSFIWLIEVELEEGEAAWLESHLEKFWR